MVFGGRHQARGNDDAGQHFGAKFQLNARALYLIEKNRQRAPVADLKRELGEFVGQRLAGIVMDARDLCATPILQRQRLEHVVHIGALKV